MTQIADIPEHALDSKIEYISCKITICIEFCTASVARQELLETPTVLSPGGLRTGR